MHATSQLVILHAALQTEPNSGHTLLHETVGFLECKIYLSYQVYNLLLSITKMIIRYGCPVDKRNADGLTARELVTNYINKYQRSSQLTIGRFLNVLKTFQVRSMDVLSKRLKTSFCGRFWTLIKRSKWTFRKRFKNLK